MQNEKRSRNVKMGMPETQELQWVLSIFATSAFVNILLLC